MPPSITTTRDEIEDEYQMSLECSPETTLQNEDRCCRPGQTREVHVHYILSGMPVDEQMNDLIMQKWAA